MFIIKIYFFKKTEEYQFCELILFSQTPERNLPWCFSWKNTFHYKSEEVTCTVDGWMLWACLHTSNFFQAESLFWNVGDSVYYYYTHACMLTPAGKLVCCYLCGHGLTETFILVPGISVAGTGACKSLFQFSAPLLTYSETSAKQKTAVCCFPVCHRRCIASIWLAHCGISSSNVCTLLEIFLLKIIVLFFQFPIHLCCKVHRSFLRSQLHGYLSPDRFSDLLMVVSVFLWGGSSTGLEESLLHLCQTCISIQVFTGEIKD